MQGTRASLKDYSRVVLAVLVCWLSACVPSPAEPTEEWRCAPLPDTFQEDDLVGTWRAKYLNRTDTLIVRADGTYRQEYRGSVFEYSGPWEKWYLEQRPSGGLYMHLEGMRYCLGTNSICQLPGGGGGSFMYRDPCEGRLITDMFGEVILVVQGSAGLEVVGVKSAPRGIVLRQMRFSTPSGDHFFVLQE